MNLADFYKGRKILITGHTGFKGAWMCKVLSMFQAEVTGYALNPPTQPNLYDLLEHQQINSYIGDIRDFAHLKEIFSETNPEIVIHMAAQPIVRESYKNPVYTYETNVMGTVNILECIRQSQCVKSFINVTTDKVYLNKEWSWGYRENEELNGYDPYSNSKSCSELVTSSYFHSFFKDMNIAISTCRAGNVIGGGDFATDRIIPDCIRAVSQNMPIIVRNPHSTRPYQHVLEPVMAYLLLAKAQYEDPSVAGSYNIGPNDTDCWTTADLVTLFCKKWNVSANTSIRWENQQDNGPHEANFLKLDCSKIKHTLHWHPQWNVETAMEKVVEWAISYHNNTADTDTITQKQIQEYLSRMENVL